MLLKVRQSVVSRHVEVVFLFPVLWWRPTLLRFQMPSRPCDRLLRPDVDAASVSIVRLVFLLTPCVLERSASVQPRVNVCVICFPDFQVNSDGLPVRSDGVKLIKSCRFDKGSAKRPAAGQVTTPGDISRCFCSPKQVFTVKP